MAGSTIEELLRETVYVADQQTRLKILDEVADAIGAAIYGPSSSQIIVELVGCLTSQKYKLQEAYREAKS